jgi:dienelactone hydrolase
MTVRMRTIDYQDGDTPLAGELAWDDAWTSPRPAVVVVHDAMKATGGFEEGRAATLAGQGYAGFVLDVYGKGVHGRDFDESLALMPRRRSPRSTRDGWRRSATASAECASSTSRARTRRCSASRASTAC